MYKQDVIVVGAGVAGLSFAIQLAKIRPECSIAVLAKAQLDFSNTYFAQGGIATVTNLKTDSFEDHIADTLKSGAGLSSPAIVETVVKSGPQRIHDLVEYGVEFNYQKNGDFDLALEGGHSKPRVVHSFDHTGANVQKALLETAKSLPNISFYEFRFSIELLQTEANEVKGVTVLNLQTNEIEIFESKLLVLATGGSGQVYKNTTNPSVATGDGIAMGIKVGAMTSHLNFVQFHPTALYQKNTSRLDLLTEAIRGFGAYVVNHLGKRFLLETETRGELATRDIVSLAIFKELEKSGRKCVYLDCRHLDKDEFKKTFPQITANLISKNLNFETDLLPIVPAAHYQCGGLTVTEKSQTNIKCLYAIGEGANTGLHGENRLASNSLLEGLVFGHDTAEWIAGIIDEIEPVSVKNEGNLRFSTENDAIFQKTILEIKTIMSSNATIAATAATLEMAAVQLAVINNYLATLQADNVVSEMSLIVTNLLLNAQAIVNEKLLHINKNSATKVVENESFSTLVLK